MKAARNSFILLIALTIGCEREERDFHVTPSAANTTHAFRYSELQPGTTRPSPHEQATTTTAPSVSPATSPAGRRLLPPHIPAPAVVEIRAFAEAPRPRTPQPDAYGQQAYALAEGKRLFAFFNCIGCHAHGGGGMGPPLMDEKWIYGHEPEQVFATIVHGRPDGMPAFGGRIPDYQIWQLAQYVRSMSGMIHIYAAPSRADQMRNKKPENSKEPPEPRNIAPPRPPEAAR